MKFRQLRNIFGFNSGRIFLPSIVISILVVSIILTPTTASALIPGACNCVIFRLDGIQDYWINSVQIAVMDKFISKNEKVNIGIFGNFIGNDVSLIAKVNSGLQSGNFELDVSGWNYVDYTTLSLSQQTTTLQQSNAKFQGLWAKSSTTFDPPYNKFNSNTLQAMKNNGFKIISSEFAYETDLTKIYKAIPDSDIKDTYTIYHLPQKIEFYNQSVNPPTKIPLNTIMTSVNDAINQYGYAVITLHIQDFSVKDSNQSPTNVVKTSEITDLDTLITTIKNNGYTIKTFNSVTVPIQPTDNIPPVIAPHSDISASATSSSGAIVTYTSPTTSDNVDAPGTATCSPLSGTLFAIGTTQVTCNATDIAGNHAIPTTFNVIVSDTTPPIIASHANVSASATSSSGAIVTYTSPTTSDNVDAPGTATCSPLSGTLFAIGTTQVTCNATDAAGNHAIPTTFNVIVSDTTPPIIASHANVSASATSSSGAIVTYTSPTTSDNVDAPGIATCSALSGTLFAIGTTQVTCNATDAAGNPAIPTTFNVIVSEIPSKIAGWWSSEVGAGNQYWHNQTDPSYWNSVAQQMSSKFPGSSPGGVLVIGFIEGTNSAQNTYLSFPKPVGTYPNVDFGAVDTIEPLLTAYDSAGLKVYLEVQPANADVSMLMDLVLNRYKQHPSVIGFGVDVEWYHQSEYPGFGRPLTDSEVNDWATKVKTFSPTYNLMLTHWDSSYLSNARPSNVVFTSDDLDLGSLTSATNSYVSWIDHFAPSKVGLDIGYIPDMPWWNLLTDPAYSIIDSVSNARPGANIAGVFWVNFTVLKVFPDTGTPQLDNISPTIAPHSDISASATSSSGAIVTYTSPTTSDNVDAPGTATCSPLSGTLFAIGTTQVTCNATDIAGNHAIPTTFNVIVSEIPSKIAGWRSSEYGNDNSYGHDQSDPNYWISVAQKMSSKFPGSSPGGVLVIGEIDGAPGTATSTFLPFSNPGGTYPNVTFGTTDAIEPLLTAYDNAGLKVYLQVESADADVPMLMDLIMNRYKQHPSVIGFGVDVEWYHQKQYPDGRPLTDAELIAWANQVKTFNPNYGLMVKHWDFAWLSNARPDNVLFVTDSEQIGSLSAATSEYIAWIDHFGTSNVGFQIGYPSDMSWWSTLTDPASSIINPVITARPNANIGAIFWVDFSVLRVFPTSVTPSVTINDVIQVEGNSGTTNFVFTVTRNVNTPAISVQYSTADDTATSPSDYNLISLTTLNFADGGPLTQQVTVSVNGNTVAEPTERFFINLSNCIGCAIADNQGIGTITDDDAISSQLFSDNFQSGFTKWTETGEGDWNLEAPVEKQIPAHTSNIVAHSDNCDTSCTITMSTPIDLRAYSSATLTFWRYVDNDLDSGEYLQVQVYDGSKWNTVFNWTNNAGDDDTWHQETVNLGSYLSASNFNVRFVTFESSTAEEAEIDDVLISGVYSGPITPSVTINDVIQVEGNSGTTNFVFTVTRNVNTPAISVQYSTADDTATSPSDYNLISLTTLNFADGGPLTQQVTVSVNGNTVAEPTERFFINLSNCIGCAIADNQGIGTITDDDAISSQLFSDNFQSGFTKWTETGEGDWNLEAPVEKQIPAHTSNIVAHSDNCDTSCTITMSTPIDLRAYSSATLTFWRYVDNDLDSGEYLQVQVYDGSKWNTVFNWTNNAGDDDTWHQETVNLGSYLSASNFNVRFVTFESSTAEEAEIDDVLISGMHS